MSYLNRRIEEWKDIVDVVQHANLDQEKSFKERERHRHRKYFQDIDQEIHRHQEQNLQISREKIAERRFIEKEVEVEKSIKKNNRQRSIQKQIRYRDDNKELLQRIKSTKKQIEKYPQNPFVKLVDEQDVRNKQFKEKLTFQNQINHFQQQIKIKQKKVSKDLDAQDKVNFQQYVENLYNKKCEDRNNFKRKYLRLRNPQKEESFLERQKSSQHLSHHDSLQKQYESYLNHQVERKILKKLDRELVDEEMKRINTHISHPDSSPAFLGRNIANYDRKKQLSYIQKNLGISHMDFQENKPKHQTIKTETGLKRQQPYFVNPGSKEPSYLMKFYNNQAQSSIAERQGGESSIILRKRERNVSAFNGKNENIFRRAENEPSNLTEEINRKTEQKHLNYPQARRLRTEVYEPKERKGYITYDVITGKNKLIYF